MHIWLSNVTGTLFDHRTELYRREDPISASWLVPLALLILGSALANIVVITTWIKNPQLQTSSNLHIVSLAMADGLVAIVSMPNTALRMTGQHR